MQTTQLNSLKASPGNSTGQVIMWLKSSVRSSLTITLPWIVNTLGFSFHIKRRYCCVQNLDCRITQSILAKQFIRCVTLGKLPALIQHRKHLFTSTHVISCECLTIVGKHSPRICFFSLNLSSFDFPQKLLCPRSVFFLLPHQIDLKLSISYYLVGSPISHGSFKDITNNNTVRVIAL